MTTSKWPERATDSSSGAGARQRPQRVLILGRSRLAFEIVWTLESRPELGCEVVGMLERPASTGTADATETASDWLERMLARYEPDWLIVAPIERRGALPMQGLLRRRLAGLRIDEAAVAFERLTGKLPIESLNPSGLLFSDGFRRGRFYEAIDRTLSMGLASVGLVVSAPVLILAAAAIKLDSPGPVLFRQARIGRGGKAFALLKLRTMRMTAAEPSLWVRDNHQRITRSGRWLRKFRLDELPQFINVLRGEMSFVGPRPHPQDNFELFDRHIPYYWMRNLVRPGITGWAQVRYGYANTLAEETEKVRYDLYYIKHQSFLLNLRILLATIREVLVGRSTSARAKPFGDIELREMQTHETQAGPNAPDSLDQDDSDSARRSQVPVHDGAAKSRHRGASRTPAH